MFEFAGVLEVDFDYFHRQLAENRGNHLARHSIGGIDSNLHFLYVRPEKLQDVFFVFVGQITAFDRAGSLTLGMKQGHRDMLNIFQAGIAADRFGVQAGYLESVIFGRVMRSRNLNAAARAKMIDCEIHLGRINHSYIYDICACGVHSVDESFCQRFAVRSHITADA